MAEIEAPLDAYATAKANEPTFTLQGGDPLAAPLVRLWAELARVRAGLAGSLELRPLTDAATYAENDRERDELKLRATKAEELSWDMDAYLHGTLDAGETESSGEKLAVTERLDLHDLRLLAASRVSNMFCELLEIQERLTAAKFDATDNLWDVNISVAIKQLQHLHHILEPAAHRQRYARKG